MRQGLSKPLIARVLGGAPKWTIAELEQKFPPRDLPDGAMVTRFAPSPTGYYHLGNLYQNVIAENLAHCAGDGRARGVFYMRIEDTDTKREVAGAVDTLVSSMAKFGFKLDEGMIAENTEVGEYGPYTQSARKDIYHAIAAELLATGRAYPCFLTSEEMEDIRKKQSLDGLPTGIYGEWARDRDLTGEEITAKLDAGKIPSIRLYSTGDPSRKIYCKDAMRGSIEFPENNSDEIIIKSNDRLPTYHFAHLVDDHFMRTTHVVRAIEWLPSLPLHVQMFTMMGWELPVYIHHATVDILDAETGNRRKISKRKDRVAAFKNLWADGWAPEVFLEYIFNLIVSGYEEAKIKNPSLTVWDYPIKIKKLPVSGALLDMKKMEWWAREFIATLDESNYEITNRVIDWAREYAPEWYERIVGAHDCAQPKGVCNTPLHGADYLHDILSIERENPKRIRKDFITWKQTLEEVSYFFDDLFDVGSVTPSWGGLSGEARLGGASSDKIAPPRQSPLAIDTPPQEGGDAPSLWRLVLSEFLKTFSITDDRDVWWGKVKDIAAKLGIQNGDAAMALRVALTGRTNSPDLYSVMQVMGKDRVVNRLNKRKENG